MDGDVETAAFEVPEGDVDAGNGGHEDGAAAVKTETPDHLPDVFDVAVYISRSSVFWHLGERGGGGQAHSAS